MNFNKIYNKILYNLCKTRDNKLVNPFLNGLKQTIPAWEPQQKIVDYFFTFSKKLIVLSGNEGIGKSTFIKNLQQEALNTFTKIQFSATPNSTITQLHEALFKLLSLRSELPITPSFCDYYLQELQDKKTHHILIIDDAHLLPKEILQEISTLVILQENTYLHFILSGNFKNDDIHNIFTTFEHDDYLHVLELPKIALEELSAYFSHCMRNLKISDKQHFTNNQIINIYKQANGNIGKINELASILFEQNKHKKSEKLKVKKSNKSVSISRDSITIISFLTFVVGILSFWHYENNQYLEKKYHVAMEQFDNHLNQIKKTSEYLISNSDKQIRLAEKSSNELSSIGSTIRNADVNGAHIFKRNASSEFKIKFNKILNSIKTNKIEFISKNIATKNTQPKLVKGSKIKKNKKQIPNHKVSRLVIQFLASDKLSTIQTFIERHKLTNKVKSYKTFHNEKLWYILAYGNYKTKKEAQKKSENLPAVISNRSTWIRTTKFLTPIKIGLKTYPKRSSSHQIKTI